MTFFFGGRRQSLISKNKKTHHEDKITVNIVVQICGIYVHLRLRKREKLLHIYRKFADFRLRNPSCSFVKLAVAELSVNLRCPALPKYSDRIRFLVNGA